MANKKKKTQPSAKKSAPAKKSAAQKKPAKKAGAKKATAKKTKAPKSAVKKAGAQKAAVKKATAKKVTSKKISSPKKTVTKKAAPQKAASKPVQAQATLKATPVKAKVVDYSKAITPLLDRLVVRVLQGERVTAGGLIIPDTVSMMATGYLKAEVVAVGHGSKNKKGHIKPLDVQIGDHVLFAQHAGTKIEFNAEELQIIHESDVMGILQNSI